MNKNVSERWWNIYLNDDGCKKNFNGLHLVCAMYGDGDDSDTLMQSMAGNKNYQLENLEFSSNDSLFKDTISSCMWNDQYPEGYFAHLQSELPDIRGSNGEERNGKIVVKDWHNPWISSEAEEYANYIRGGWQR